MECRNYSACVPGSRALVVDACTDRVGPGCSLALLQGHIPPIDETPEGRGVRQLSTEVPFEEKTPTEKSAVSGPLFDVSSGWAGLTGESFHVFVFLRLEDFSFVLGRLSYFCF